MSVVRRTGLLAPGVVALLSVTVAGCARPTSPDAQAAAATEDAWRAKREALVEDLERREDLHDERVLAALRRVERHRFVPDELADLAYDDRPLPIGHQQTISQPAVVAIMTQAAEVEPGDRVLEVGTGSGYQAAILAELVDELWTIEIVEPLAERARATLDELGYDRVHTRTGDGYRGWPEEAPFDAIVVTAAPDHVPEPLLEQLAPGGRLVLPVGARSQELLRIRRTPDGFEREVLLGVRFVPMTGEALENDR